MGGSSHGGATMGGTSTAGGSPVADLTCRPRPATSCTKPTVNQWSNWPVADRGHQYTTTADTATDAVTGLTWQRQVATLSGSSCGGPALFTWPEASCYCDSLTLPGATSGWRLPSRSELSSLIEFGAEPTINASVFPGSMAEIYWTSSGNDQKQWEVNFAAPSVNAVPDPTGAHFVRCVRGGTAAPATRYSAGTGTLAGTVLDNATKLRWQKVQLGPGDAASLGQQCAASTLGQLTWRLPSISELLTTIDESVESPALDTNFFAGSADAKVTSATSEREGYFDGVTYGWGQSIALSASSTDVYARCVSN